MLQDLELKVAFSKKYLRNIDFLSTTAAAKKGHYLTPLRGACIIHSYYEYFV